MFKLFVAASAVVAVATAAQAPSSDATRVGPNQDGEQVICVHERLPDSVFMKRRICRTRAEWAEHRAEARRGVEKIQNYRPTH